MTVSLRARSEAARKHVTCSGCGERHQRDGQRYCKDCHSKYMRGWRPNNPLTGKPKERAGSRAIAGVYKRRKILHQKPCLVCGDLDSQMHHPDHELPLDVVWMCRPCHLIWHEFWRSMILETFARWAVAARAAFEGCRTDSTPTPHLPVDAAQLTQPGRYSGQAIGRAASPSLMRRGTSA